MTFRRPGYRQMIIDITLTSGGVARTIDNWRVRVDFTVNDLHYIFVSVWILYGPRYKQLVAKETKFNTAKLNTNLIQPDDPQRIQRNQKNRTRPPVVRGHLVRGMRVVLRACETSMPRKNAGKKTGCILVDWRNRGTMTHSHNVTGKRRELEITGWTWFLDEWSTGTRWKGCSGRSIKVKRKNLNALPRIWVQMSVAKGTK